LHAMIEQVDAEVEVVGLASSFAEAKTMITDEAPDLVFLNIQWDEGTGFDLLEQLGPANFEVIFTSAHDTYALKAFRFNAIDYLLKPTDPQALRNAIFKAKKMKQGGEQYLKKVSTLVQNIGVDSGRRKLTINTIDGIQFIRLKDIIAIESDSNYSIFHLREKKRVIASKTLKEFDELLDNSDFFRIHNSYLINLNYVEKLHKGDVYKVDLPNAMTINVSKGKKAKLVAALSVFHGA
jgi:two-component system LytT family response regulator